MDTILLIVTGLSLAMAGVMAALLVRMLREERRRSDARVALLQRLASEPAAARPQHGPPVTTVRRDSPPARGGSDVTAVNPTDRRTLAPSRRLPERPPVTVDDLALHAGAPAVSTQDIFQPHDLPSAWPQRLALLAGIAAVLVAVIFGWTVTRPAVVVNPPAAQAGDQPLELLSLQHAQRNGTLVITGVVQNPRSARAVGRVQATVLLFGPDGGLVGSGRAPVDFTTLAPGDESPFVVRVPVSRHVSRYRVGFRGENDRVLGHVDRRDPGGVARKEVP